MWDADGRPVCPDDLVAHGGAGSIAEQLIAADVDVLLGGGYARFAQADEAGVPVLERAEAAGYQLVRDAVALATPEPGGGKVLGLFGDDTLPVAWAGTDGRLAQPVVLAADGQPVPPEPFTCVDNPRVGDRPTLATMTGAALSRLEPWPEGFFLMVESASIDKRAHAGDPCGQIGETQALDEAVQTALHYQEHHPDTLIVVASDHGHAPQIVPWPSLFASRAEPQYPTGKLALLRTPADGLLAIAYGTNAHYLEEHTGTQVPVFAEGPGASAVGGLIRQTDLFDIMVAAMRLE